MRILAMLVQEADTQFSQVVAYRFYSPEYYSYAYVRGWQQRDGSFEIRNSYKEQSTAPTSRLERDEQ